MTMIRMSTPELTARTRLFRGDIMDKVKIIIFDKRERDWMVWKEGFKSEAEAEKFVADFPAFGHDYSRTIREGNWQVITSHNED